MSKKTTAIILNILIWALILLGIQGTYGLVYNEFSMRNICPKISVIPACYIIMGCLIFALLVQLNLLKNKFYFIGTGIAVFIAIIGTIGNLTTWLICPKTASGMPMCYISLMLFGSLIALKIFTIHFEKKK